MRSQISTQNFYRFTLPQNLITCISLLLLTLCFFGGAWGQVVLTNGSASASINFSNTTPTSVGSNPTTAFNGSGFDVNPTTSGRLNSNAWSITGWTDGSLSFGGTKVAVNTDFTRGATSSSISTAGIYAYTGSPQSASNPCLMIQPGSGDWAPGSITLRLFNNGTTNINALSVSYNIYVRNDQTRSNSFNFSHCTDNSTFINESSLDYSSTAATDALGWVLIGTSPSRSITINNLDVAPNSYYYLRWSGAEVTGIGARDEFGLDDINISAVFASPTPVLNSVTLSSNLSSNYGASSSSVSATAGGSNLSSTITITPETNFEVSTTSSTSGFTSSAITGIANNTTFWTRLASTASIGSYNNVTAAVMSSTGATSVNITTSSSGNAVTCTNGAWIGGTSGNWNNANNWCGGSVPTSASNVTIPSGVTVILDAATTTVASLTIDGTLEVAAGKQLTVIGTLTNNGTFLLHDGATFVQGASGTSIAGTGTFTVEKSLSGNNSTWSSTSGRFWYMGVPMENVARSSFGSYASGTNRVWSYAEATKLYTDITDNTATLNAGTGYVHRRSADGTLTFSANGLDGLYRTDVSLPSLTRTAGASAGYHLISNPYMAYLDWDAVIAANGTTNIESTYYIRSAEPSNNNALISYNSNGPNYVSGGVTSIDQLEDVQYIAPMQSIWVRVGTASATGSLVMNRGMLSHQSNNPGLKNSSIFPTSARVNLVDGSRFDQILVFMNQDMSNGVDQFDSEKMFVNGAPQIYTMASNKKLVMNGLKNNKKKISVPLYLELPESKVYNLQLTEYILEDGLILLEDKQEGTIQDFTINNTYAFYANSGVLSNRFVLHFYMPDAGVSAQGPSNSWVEEETSYIEGGDVFISSDSKGKIQITLDQPVAENITGLVQATDVNGKIVFTTQLMGLFTEFQMNVPSGIYYLSVQNGNIFQSKKVFVQN